VEAAAQFHALVPAAGRGERFGGDVPKQFLEIAGRPLLAWTIERLLAAGAASVVVALPDDFLDRAGTLHEFGASVRFVAGGATRQASVAEALAASPAATGELVAVHDGARAAVDPRDVAAAVAAASAADGAVLGRVATDTIKEVEGGRILGTLERARMFRAETPQVFRRELLELGLERARLDRFAGTDEAMLVERLGALDIRAVEARRPNPKVTWAEDLAWLGRLFAAEEWR
jgi:2-C-methyl-D-erythritol 4-phosphate cytidylyltransferase